MALSSFLSSRQYLAVSALPVDISVATGASAYLMAYKEDGIRPSTRGYVGCTDDIEPVPQRIYFLCIATQSSLPRISILTRLYFYCAKSPSVTPMSLITLLRRVARRPSRAIDSFSTLTMRSSKFPPCGPLLLRRASYTMSPECDILPTRALSLPYYNVVNSGAPFRILHFAEMGFQARAGRIFVNVELHSDLEWSPAVQRRLLDLRSARLLKLPSLPPSATLSRSRRWRQILDPILT